MASERLNLIRHCAALHQGVDWLGATSEELREVLRSNIVPTAWANGKTTRPNGGNGSATGSLPGTDLASVIAAAISDKLPSQALDEEAVKRIVDDRLSSRPNTIVELVRTDGETVKTKDTDHAETANIVRMLSAGLNIWMVGPAASGKTTIAERAAELLGSRFIPISVGPQTSKSDLLGYISATGTYIKSLFRDAYENGGILLLDEVDSANGAVLTIINAALANGYCSFPDAVVKRSPSFRVLCAANTRGTGADRQYVGRAQLDAATLDRFVQVEIDYDEDAELKWSGNDEWTKKVQEWRHRAAELSLRIIISPRASIHGARLLAAGFSEDKVADCTVWKGLDKETVAKIKGND